MIPMMPAPMMSQGSSGQNSQGGAKNGVKSGGGFDPLKAIMEGPSMILGQLLAQDLVQAKQSGVPTDSLIQTLLSMSPLAAGIGAGKSLGETAGASMMGGGNQPPGGPQPPNGGGPPPQGPGPGGVQNDQTASQGGPAQLNPGQLQNSPYQQGQPGFGNPQPGNINQAFLGGQQGGQQAPGGYVGNNSGPGFYNAGGVNAQTGAYSPASLLGGLIRQHPNDIATMQGSANSIPNNQVRMTKEKAEQVPLGKARKEELAMESTNTILEKMAGLASTGDDTTRKKIGEGKAFLSDLDNIEKTYLNTFGKGGGTMEGMWVGALKKANLAQNAKSYEDYVEAATTKFGKFVGEDRFTDDDRKVFKKLFPAEFTNKRNVRLRFAMIRSMANSTLNNYEANDKSTGFAERGKKMLSAVEMARKNGYNEDQIREYIMKGLTS